MPVHPDFARYSCELLSSIGPCVARRMFGGWGVSCEGMTLALAVNLGEGDTLWLKADAQTQACFEAAGCRRFTYMAQGLPKQLMYYAAPEDAMESPDAMQAWAALAWSSAVRAAAAKAAKAQRPRRSPPGATSPDAAIPALQAVTGPSRRARSKRG